MNFISLFHKPQADIIIRHTNVLAPRAEGFKERLSVLISGGKIKALLSPEEISQEPADPHSSGLVSLKVRGIPGQYYVIDGTGAFLIPGLVDMHVHLLENRDDLFLYPAFGVTSVRNMAGIHQPRILELHPRLCFSSHIRLREAIRRERLCGPDIFTAGPIIDGIPLTWPWPLALSLTNRKKIPQILAFHRKRGFDFLKVYRRLSEEIFRELLAEAYKLNIPVCGHVPRAAGIEKALEWGIHSVEHLVGYFDYMRPAKAISREEYARFADLTARKKVWNCPTLVLWHNACPPEEAASRKSDAFGKYLSPKMKRMTYAERSRLLAHIRKTREFDYPSRQLENCFALTRALFEAGAGILAGTDTATAYTVAGFSLHQELEHLAAAGLPLGEVLNTATINAASCLGTQEVSGSIEAGKNADLLLLEKNPLEDIRHTRLIRGVLKRGLWLSSEKRQEGLSALEKRYRS